MPDPEPRASQVTTAVTILQKRKPQLRETESRSHGESLSQIEFKDITVQLQTYPHNQPLATEEDTVNAHQYVQFPAPSRCKGGLYYPAPIKVEVDTCFGQ